MKRTWMLRAAGILCIIAGAVIVVIPIGMLVAAGVAPTTSGDDVAGFVIVILFCIPSIMLGTFGIVGGVYALRREILGLALAGSIALIVCGGLAILLSFLISFPDKLLVGFEIVTILAIVFIVLGKGEFKAKVPAGDISPKSRLRTALFAFFLGVFGAHRFYIGRTRTAIVMLLLTIAGWGESILCFVGHGFFVAVWFIMAAGIWAFVDFIVAVTGNMTDKEGRLIKE